MASKRRIRRNACLGKVRHPTAEAGIVAKRILIRKQGWTGDMNVYKCRFCNGYHVGHSRM